MRQDKEGENMMMDDMGRMTEKGVWKKVAGGIVHSKWKGWSAGDKTNREFSKQCESEKKRVRIK